MWLCDRRRLRLRGSGENFLSWCKDSHGIKIGLSLRKSGPLIPKVLDPILP